MWYEKHLFEHRNHKMKEEIRARLKAFRKELKVTQGDIASVLGLDVSSWTHIETTGRASLSIDHLLTLMTTYQLNPNFILRGDDPMFLNDTQPSIQNLFIPADRWPEYPGSKFDKVIIPTIKGEARTFEVHGDDMYPVLMHGDLVACTQLKSMKDLDGSKIYVITTANTGFIMSYVRPSLTGLYLMPENAQSKLPESIDHLNIREVWEVKLRITAFLMHSRKLK